MGVTAKAFEQRLFEALAERGLRQTGPRRTIAEVFFDGGREEHLGLEEIHRRARRRDRRIGYATVYRTMKLLSELGLAHERHFGDGMVRYEVAETGHHHDHLICTRCARILEFEEPRIEELQESVAEQHGFRIEWHRHEIYGLCDRCSG